MLTIALALLAAASNAAASVLQRKANKDIPQEEQMSLRLVHDLLDLLQGRVGMCVAPCRHVQQHLVIECAPGLLKIIGSHTASSGVQCARILRPLHRADNSTKR